MEITKYEILLSNEFEKNYHRFTRKNKELKIRIDKTLHQLLSDPFYIGLRTHKAEIEKFGYKYSSRVTGDIRIIWDFIDSKPIILAITILGHEVYK